MDRRSEISRNLFVYLLDKRERDEEGHQIYLKGGTLPADKSVKKFDVGYAYYPTDDRFIPQSIMFCDKCYNIACIPCCVYRLKKAINHSRDSCRFFEDDDSEYDGQSSFDSSSDSYCDIGVL